MTNSLTVIAIKYRSKRLTGNGTHIRGDEKQHLKLVNTEKKQLSRLQHRQNNHKVYGMKVKI